MKLENIIALFIKFFAIVVGVMKVRLNVRSGLELMNILKISILMKSFTMLQINNFK